MTVHRYEDLKNVYQTKDGGTFNLKGKVPGLYFSGLFMITKQFEVIPVDILQTQNILKNNNKHYKYLMSNIDILKSMKINK